MFAGKQSSLRRTTLALVIGTLVTLALWLSAPAHSSTTDGYRVQGGQSDALERFRLQWPLGNPRVRAYNLVITAGHATPNGVTRQMLLINGEFPGPLIEGLVGDTLRITVRNALPENTTVWDGSYRDVFSSMVDDYLPPGAESNVAFHWHGLSMRGSPEMDGAPGFTSRPIPPGSEGVYEFTLHEEDVGTHWYHSHVGMQRSDGLLGPLVVHPADREDLGVDSVEGLSVTTVDDQVVLLGDHYHTPGISQLAWFISRQSLGFEPTPDAVLINGRGVYDCAKELRPAVKANCDDSAEYATIYLTQGTVNRLRLVNVGAVGHTTFSIDEHKLTVIEADGTPIVPFTTTRLSIAPGQRYSVLVAASHAYTSGSAFWMRAEMDHECFNVPTPSTEYAGKAIVRYRPNSSKIDLRKFRLRPRDARDQHSFPTTAAWESGSEGDGKQVHPCHDMPMALLRPQHPVDLPPEGDSSTLKILVTVTMPKLDKNALVPVSYMNRTSWRHAETASSVPLLESFASANLSALADPLYPADPYAPLPEPDDLPYDPEIQMVIHAPVTNSSEPSWVEVVINNSEEAPHPFHLHGHKFVVLESSESAVGWGAYSAGGNAARNTREYGPVVRDTFSIPRRGYARFAWRMDNPGVWAFHCHVLVHMATGMAMAFVDLPEKLAQVV